MLSNNINLVQKLLSKKEEMLGDNPMFTIANETSNLFSTFSDLCGQRNHNYQTLENCIMRVAP